MTVPRRVMVKLKYGSMNERGCCSSRSRGTEWNVTLKNTLHPAESLPENKANALDSGLLSARAESKTDAASRLSVCHILCPLLCEDATPLAKK